MVAVLGMTYRYILLLLESAHDMFVARRSRAGRPPDGRRTAPPGGPACRRAARTEPAARRRGLPGDAGARVPRRGVSRGGLRDEARRLDGARGVRGRLGGRDVGGPMNLFELDDVTYRFNRVVALDGLSMAIPSGTRVALLGANGSGKSTLLRILDGLYFPDSGRVRFLGEELTEPRLADDDVRPRFPAARRAALPEPGRAAVQRHRLRRSRVRPAAAARGRRPRFAPASWTRSSGCG